MPPRTSFLKTKDYASTGGRRADPCSNKAVQGSASPVKAVPSTNLTSHKTKQATRGTPNRIPGAPNGQGRNTLQCHGAYAPASATTSSRPFVLPQNQKRDTYIIIVENGTQQPSLMQGVRHCDGVCCQHQLEGKEIQLLPLWQRRNQRAKEPTLKLTP